MKFLLLIALALTSIPAFSQVYSEFFENQETYGIQGLCGMDPLSCDSVNLPGPTGWTITGDASGMLNAEDHFMVINGQLLARDTDGELCFQSPVVSVAECDSFDVSVLIEETGDLESNDYVDVFIMADDSLFLVPDWLESGDSSHTLTGDFPDDQDWQSTTISVERLHAESMSLKVCVRNNSGTETIRLDEIDVTCSISSVAPNVFISELDCDQPGQDTAEFIELAGPPGTSLDGFLLVLYNGIDDASYAAYDLQGEVLNELGLFTICFGSNQGMYCDLSASGQLQNGADGIGLYYGRDISEFPTDTPIDSLGLVDGLSYSTGEAVDTGLMVLNMDDDCGDTCQIDEEPSEYSIQRGSWFVALPTPGAPNTDPLSVTWRKFNVTYEDGLAHLVWTTESEFHNAYFSIEYARDRGVFAEIGRVDGQHSSRTSRLYRWQHKPHVEGTNHYYRVKAVDENGRHQYSAIRVVSSLGEPDVHLWPTSARQSFYVDWPAGETADFSLHSLHGARVYSMGRSDAGFVEVDVSNLTNGIYIAQLNHNAGTTVWKIAVRH